MNLSLSFFRLLLALVCVAACGTATGLRANPTTTAPDGTVLPGTSWVIHAGALIDVQSGAVRRQVSIAVRDGKVAAVTDGFARPRAGETVIDLRQYTVLPGLMDMHTHLTSEHSKQSYSESFFLDPADYALRSALYARRTLMAGFTTVRDLGDRNNVSISLREAIAKGWVVGPRIFTAGKSIATTGGHADPTNGLNQEYTGNPGPAEGVINSPGEARQAVRQRYKDGADLIKITATGGVLSLAGSGQNPQFVAEELEAIVAAAHDYGFTVAVHAHGTEGMKRAVEAGVDSIEHGTFMTDEVIALMKQRGTYYVPTISAGKWVAAKAAEADYFPDVVRPKAAAIGPQIAETFARAHRAGVKIAFGTDSGVSPHGENAREFVYMVESGMTPLAAIQAATVEAAKLLRVQDRLGAVDPGKLADIVAVRGDPLKNIEVMLDVAFVMKDGRVYKLPAPQ
ncbi:MAG TPA: amidohydrolase family protein [Haliangium sp.]|nr:amidohydrolase family protein [Haliangium sp.]